MDKQNDYITRKNVCVYIHYQTNSIYTFLCFISYIPEPIVYSDRATKYFSNNQKQNIKYFIIIKY